MLAGPNLRRTSHSAFVRQLFERRLTGAGEHEQASLLVGPAAAAGPLLLGKTAERSAGDTSFAVLHGLYWLTANLSAVQPLLLAVDDAHWADEPSLRWLTYLARRMEGLSAGLVVALRPCDPAVLDCWSEDEAKGLAQHYADLWRCAVKLYRVPFVNMGSDPWAAEQMHFICRIEPTSPPAPSA